MRGALLIGTAAVALLGVSTALAEAERDVARPVVRVAQLSPLVVAGESFKPRQRIVIRVTADTGVHVRRMRTTRRGTFAARFAAVSVDRCGGGLSVVVTTATGLVAKTRRPPMLCPPPSASP